jgi:hypothetical protein
MMLAILRNTTTLAGSIWVSRIACQMRSSYERLLPSALCHLQHLIIAARTRRWRLDSDLDLDPQSRAAQNELS